MIATTTSHHMAWRRMVTAQADSRLVRMPEPDGVARTDKTSADIGPVQLAPELME
jgi:hypothetical protein